jgi:prepilin-type N-terminal cleavage/methylation domain-containing protein
MPCGSGCQSGGVRGLQAFTLLELLTVIAIIGILAAVALPTIRTFKPNIGAAASSQLLGDVDRARQLAITHRTTVYMIFVPTNFFNDPVYGNPNWTSTDFLRASNLFDKQLMAYTFVSLHSLGDQPGSNTVTYLGPWRSVPQGAFIPLQKFKLQNNFVLGNQAYSITNRDGAPYLVWGFSRTNNIPFPAENTRPDANGHYVTVPYLAFNYLGQLASPFDTRDPRGLDYIPISQGASTVPRDPVTKVAVKSLPQVNELPIGNTTNTYNLVAIESLTGRAHIEHPKIK